MAIVMGLDQHRAQITAEWIDTETGEVSRSRISPAHRAGVRGFAERFRGQELEVALEATTGWRFVAEELRRVGAVVHLAEPAETAARAGTSSAPRATAPMLNRQIRKTIKTRGHFPDEQAATKLIYLAIQRAEGAWRKPYNWTGALRGLKIHFQDRLPD